MHRTRKIDYNLKHILSAVITVIAAAVIITAAFVYDQMPIIAAMTQNDFTESTDYFSNPWTGIYTYFACDINDDASYSEESVTSSWGYTSEQDLVQVLLDIGAYKDSDISERGLSEIETIIKTFAAGGKQMIVRFRYDSVGNGYGQDPSSISIVKNHISQLSEILNRYADHVFMVQGIIVGSYGEMNTSRYLSPANVRSLARCWGRSLDKSIYITVRTPRHQRIVFSAYKLPTEDTLDTGRLVSRVGLYNDGLLGNKYDLGTYGGGDISVPENWYMNGLPSLEMNYQNQLCLYVPNGGEVAYYENSSSTFKSARKRFSKMRIGYLNVGLPEKVIKNWENSTYTKKGSIWNGMSGRNYIYRHVGYRYVIKGANIRQSGSTNNITVRIRNVGYAPAYKKFDVTLTFVPSDPASNAMTVQYQVDTDNRKWIPGSTVSITSAINTDDFSNEEYKVYLNVHDPLTGKDITFANNLERDVSGYELGSMTLDK